MMIELIPNERAFFISELKAVVVADLHIGYEKALKSEGINVKPQTQMMIENLRKILKDKDADKLIILGDVKHSIGTCRDIKKLEDLDVEIIVSKGNHDGGIEEMMNAKIYGSEGFTLGDYGFIHGHSWPKDEVMEKKYVFMGHLHPEIELRDSIGKIHRYPCHLVGKLTETGRKRYSGDPKIFVVAAFNPMVGSSVVDPIGPLMRNGVVGDFRVFLLNGTYLGKLEELQN